jgi:hypothetical protein
VDDSLIAAIGTVKARISDRIATLQDDPTWQEIKKMYQGLGTLEDMCGMPKTDLSALLGISSDGAAAVGKYEYAGQPPLEAAKRYLRKIAPKQTAASLDDIIAALEKGDLKANKDELRLSLSRSTTEIYKAGDDIYGLVESFPHIRRGTPGRRKGAKAGNGAEAKTEGGTEGDGK